MEQIRQHQFLVALKEFRVLSVLADSGIKAALSEVEVNNEELRDLHPVRKFQRFQQEYDTNMELLMDKLVGEMDFSMLDVSREFARLFSHLNDNISDFQNELADEYPEMFVKNDKGLHHILPDEAIGKHDLIITIQTVTDTWMVRPDEVDPPFAAQCSTAVLVFQLCELVAKRLRVKRWQVQMSVMKDGQPKKLIFPRSLEDHIELGLGGFEAIVTDEYDDNTVYVSITDTTEEEDRMEIENYFISNK